MSEPVITSFDIDDSFIKPVPSVRLQENVARKTDSTTLATPEIPERSYIIPGTVFTSIILLGLGFVAMKITDPETLPIRNVGVVGDFAHLSPVRLQERVGDVVRGGFFSVNVERIQQTLLEEPWIRDVAVKRVWPDRIIVTIREQVAFAQWGNNGLMNDTGEIFYPDPGSFPSGLPLLQGPENSSHNVVEMLEHVREILPQGLSVQQLVLSDRRSWELKLDAGPRIRLGKTEIIPRIKRFLEYFPVDRLNGAADIEYIDMRYTNGFALLRKPENKAALEVIQENYGKEI